MSHPVPLPHPRLTRADLASLRHLIARTAEPFQSDEEPVIPPVLPSLTWLERRFPTI